MLLSQAMYQRTTKKRPLAERLWEKVDKNGPGGCWLFQGALTGGYGVLGDADGTRYRAHRLSWELVHGSVPDGQLVLHRCDVRNCVNPDHLFLGTQKDNMEDKVKKGRHYTPWTADERKRHGYGGNLRGV